MKKILPPVLFIFFIIAMGLICWSLGSPHKIPEYYNLIGLFFTIAGLGLAIAGKRLFKTKQTNINTFNEPDVLVTEGVFQFSRNPMYLGFLVSLFGICLLMGAAISSLLLVLIFFIISDRWYIAYEEKMMKQKFGQEYDNYRKKVRRWI